MDSDILDKTVISVLKKDGLDEAIQFIDDAIDLTTDSEVRDWGWIKKVNLYEENDRLKDAIESAKKAYGHGCRQYSIMILAAQGHMDAGYFDTAKNFLEHVYSNLKDADPLKDKVKHLLEEATKKLKKKEKRAKEKLKKKEKQKMKEKHKNIEEDSSVKTSEESEFCSTIVDKSTLDSVGEECMSADEEGEEDAEKETRTYSDKKDQVSQSTRHFSMGELNDNIPEELDFEELDVPLVSFKRSTINVDGIYYGNMHPTVDGYLLSNISFVPVKDVSPAYVALGHNSRNILHFITVQNHHWGSEFTKYVVVRGKVQSLDSYLRREKMKFEIDLDKSESFDIAQKKRLWWKFIKDKFYRIFRDVVHGLIYLYDCGELFGDVKHGVFVDSQGRGKILPCALIGSTQKSDVEELRKIMQRFISYPFDSVDGGFWHHSFDLPLELEKYLDNLKSENLNFVDAGWLIDAVYFMDGDDHVRFLTKIRAAMRRSDYIPNQFHSMLNSKVVNKEKSWQDAIPPTGRYRDLLETAKVLNNSTYNSNVHLVRYMYSALTHYNDSTLPSLDDKDIVRDLRSYAPNIYIEICEALLDTFKFERILQESRKVLLPLVSVRYV